MTLVGSEGEQSREPREGPIVSVPDAAPRVRVDDPGMEVIAAEGYPVHVRISADDDVAISRLVLRRAVNGFAPVPVELTPDGPRPGFVYAKHTFDLAALGAQAGDVITYFATAADNYPAEYGGPHLAETDTFVIRVITRQDYEQLERSQYRADDAQREAEAFKKQLDELAKQREDLLKQIEALKQKIADQDGAMTAADREQMRRLQQQLERFNEQTRQLADQMEQRSERPPLYDFEQAFNDMLKEHADQLNQQADALDQRSQQFEQEMAQQPGRSGELSKQFLDDLEKQLGQQKEQGGEQSEQMQMSAQDMQKMALADELMSQAQRITAIADEQRKLADRLAEFGQRDQLAPEQQQRADQMAEQQKQLREELEDALKQLDDLAKQAADELPKMSQSAAEIAQKVREMRVPGDQADAASAARQGKGKPAHQSAEQAAANLESMIGQCCEGMQGQMAGDMDQQLKLMRSGLGQSMQQLAQSRPVPTLQSPSQGQGQSGTAMGSAMSRQQAKLVGPHSPNDAAAQARTGDDGRGDARTAAAGGDREHGPEVLTPDAAGNRAGAGTSLHGVPALYVDKTEAYLRRVAEESASQSANDGLNE
jgi:hypothetical protein